MRSCAAPEGWEARLPRIGELRRLFEGTGARVYIVGGAVRDLLLGRPCTEIDVEVYDLCGEAFAALMQSVGAMGVGKAFFVYRLGNIDLALPRTESRIGAGHRGFSVAQTQDEHAASKRRDFTVNALMLGLYDGIVRDWHGGLDDLEAGMLRHIDDEAFTEDSLRVLRAAQFAARLGFRLAPRTLELCRVIPLSDLSRERIGAEIEKLASAVSPERGIWYLWRLGVFEKLFGVRHSCGTVRRAMRESRAFTHLGKHPEKPIYIYYVLRFWLGLRLEAMARQFAFSNERVRKLAVQCRRPRVVTVRFMAALAHRMALERWLGHTSATRHWAEMSPWWREPAALGAKSAEALALGLSGEAVGLYLKRSRREALRTIPRTRI